MSQILLKLWLIGNRTLCRPIRSVIILVIKQIGLPLRGRPILLITHMITDRIGLHSVLLPLLTAFINGTHNFELADWAAHSFVKRLRVCSISERKRPINMKLRHCQVYPATTWNWSDEWALFQTVFPQQPITWARILQLSVCSLRLLNTRRICPASLKRFSFGNIRLFLVDECKAPVIGWSKVKTVILYWWYGLNTQNWFCVRFRTPFCLTQKKKKRRKRKRKKRLVSFMIT